jgi:mono/diheme cytochrome c family protein
MGRSPSAKRSGALRQQLALGIGVVLLLIGAVIWTVLSRTRPQPGSIAGADADNSALVALGRQLYATRCAGCHGASLEGTPAAPPLDASGPSPQRSDAWLFAIIKAGGQAVAPPGTTSAMPAFGAGLSDEQIWALLSYIESNWPPEVRAAQPQAP